MISFGLYLLYRIFQVVTLIEIDMIIWKCRAVGNLVLVFFQIVSVDDSYHGLRTPNEGINQRYLKN